MKNSRYTIGATFTTEARLYINHIHDRDILQAQEGNDPAGGPKSGWLLFRNPVVIENVVDDMVLITADKEGGGTWRGVSVRMELFERRFVPCEPSQGYFQPTRGGLC